MGGLLFQAGQQWQVDQWWAQEASQKQSVSLLQCRRPQAGLLSQEADYGFSQRLQCFSNCLWKTLRKIESNTRTPHRLRATLNFLVQQQVQFNSMHLLFPILIHSLCPLPLPWSLVRITLIKSHSELLSTLNLWILITWRHLQLFQLLSACLIVHQTALSLKLPTYPYFFQ